MEFPEESWAAEPGLGSRTGAVPSLALAGQGLEESGTVEGVLLMAGWDWRSFNVPLPQTSLEFFEKSPLFYKSVLLNSAAQIWLFHNQSAARYFSNRDKVQNRRTINAV